MSNPRGVVIDQSSFSVKETIDKLEAFLIQHGATIYSRIDQQNELKKAGQIVRPLEFILFGNPKAGGAIMIENPLAALDLPLKIIAWENESDQVQIAYNEQQYIEERYGLQHKENSPLSLGNLVATALK
jgi:uncharacterized protein (DUF302 family)